MYRDDIEVEATPESLRHGAEVVEPEFPLLAGILRECADAITVLTCRADYYEWAYDALCEVVDEQRAELADV